MAKTGDPVEASPSPESTEQRIFDAAHDVFLKKGLDGAKMQEIADHAGINKALLHYYYRTKEKLYESVVKAVIGRAIPVVQQMIEADLPLREKIERFVDFYVDMIGRNPFVPLFLITEMNKHPERFFEHVFPKELPKPAFFLRQVEAEIAAGTIRPFKPAHLLINIISMCIFPFLARPLIRVALGLDPAELKKFLEERKSEVKRFVFAALEP
jgi:TetR/AcrR family transcriptional regulator